LPSASKRRRAEDRSALLRHVGLIQLTAARLPDEADRQAVEERCRQVRAVLAAPEADGAPSQRRHAAWPA